MNQDLIYRLRKRAEIRRQISTRKSVLENQPDRISDLLEEAADALGAANAERRILQEIAKEAQEQRDRWAQKYDDLCSDKKVWPRD